MILYFCEFLIVLYLVLKKLIQDDILYVKSNLLKISRILSIVITIMAGVLRGFSDSRHHSGVPWAVDKDRIIGFGRAVLSSVDLLEH